MASNQTNPITAHRGFSLAELLAVLAILAVLLALGVPAIKSMLYSSEQSLAENQLRVAMTAARDAAVRSTSGDAAAVFFYADGRTTIIPCLHVGTMPADDVIVQGSPPSSGALEMARDVFVPVPNVEPIRMPRGWNIRAYAAPGTIATGPTAAQNVCGWYDSISMPVAVADEGHWVFPETSFLDAAGLNNGGAQGDEEGWKRQTFMIRFEAGTGNAVMNSRSPALVVDPMPVNRQEGFRNTAPYDVDEQDVTQAPTPEIFVRQALARANLRFNASADLKKLLGDQSADTVLAGPVTEVALYDEERMAAAIGASRINGVTQCLYGDPASRTAAPIEPSLDTSLFPPGTTVEQVQEWIDAYFTHDVGALPNPDAPLDARVFTVQRYLGQMQEVTPEIEL